MSSEGSAPGRKRKHDKSQSQLNKCFNEKRRRDQENVYIEELAELISASMSDLGAFSVKPDKCAILQETVKQIKQISSNKQQGPKQDNQNAVQQSQVSSSRSTILANEVLGPLLLEALDGFMFMVNNQGKVEYVSDNVSRYLKYTPDDLIGKSVYNIIHVGDHVQFSSSLSPMSIEASSQWSQESSSSVGNKSRTFNCRMLIKPPGDEDDELEVKQQQVSQYETMQITALLHSGDKDNSDPNFAESEPCLMCITRRIGISDNQSGMLGVEQFTTKQDRSGTVTECDTSGLNQTSIDGNVFIGQNIRNFCHMNDIPQLQKHHNEVLSRGQATSGVYRFKLQENRYVFVQTRSRIFGNSTTKKPEFIMSMHSVVRECDTDSELKGSASTSLMKSIIGPKVRKTSSRDLDSMKAFLAGQQTSNALPHSAGVTVTSVQGLSATASTSAGGASGSKSGGLQNVSLTSLLADNELDHFFSVLTSSSTVTSSWASETSLATATTTLATPSTQVSWMAGSSSSQQPTASLQQAQITQQQKVGRGQTINSINIQSRNIAGPGIKSPISPGFTTSPGFPQNRMSPSCQSQQSPMSAQRTSPATAIPNLPPNINLQGPVTPNTILTTIINNMQLQNQQRGKQGWSGGVPIKSRLSGQRAHNPLTALQSMEMLAGGNNSVVQQLGLQMGLPNSPAVPGLKSVDKANLRRLLTQKGESQNPSSSGDNPGSSRCESEDQQPQQQPESSSMMQSPQPGPGKSPPQASPQQPQSTSTEEHPDSSSREGSTSLKKEDNHILKQLLSQSDTEELEERGEDAAAVPMTSTTPPAAEKFNEAEPKKMSNPSTQQALDNNALLKRLLHEDQDMKLLHEDKLDESDERTRSTNQLLQQLLSSPEEDASGSRLLEGVTSVESTSLDTAEFLGEAVVSGSGLSGLFGKQSGGGASSSGVDENLLRLISSSSASNAQLDSFLNNLLEKSDDTVATPPASQPQTPVTHLQPQLNQQASQPQRQRGIKRKEPADSTDADAEPSTSTIVTSSSSAPSSAPPTPTGQKSQLKASNKLLSELLSRNSTHEMVINTHHTVNPVQEPHVAFKSNNPKRLIDKENSSDSPSPGTPGATPTGLEGGKPNAWDNPRTNPNTPYPGNTIGEQKMGGLATPTSSAVVAAAAVTAIAAPSSTTTSNDQSSVTSTSDAHDPLLSQILQTVDEIQNTISSSGGNLVLTDMTDDVNLIDQLDQVLKSANIGMDELDRLTGVQGSFGDMSEQMAIDAIQQQLMNIDPHPSSASVAMASATSSMPPSTAIASMPLSSGMAVTASQVSSAPSLTSLMVQQQQAQLKQLQLQQQQQLLNQLQQQQQRFQQPQVQHNPYYNPDFMCAPDLVNEMYSCVVSPSPCAVSPPAVFSESHSDIWCQLGRAKTYLHVYHPAQTLSLPYSMFYDTSPFPPKFLPAAGLAQMGGGQVNTGGFMRGQTPTPATQTTQHMSQTVRHSILRQQQEKQQQRTQLDLQRVARIHQLQSQPQIQQQQQRQPFSPQFQPQQVNFPQQMDQSGAGILENFGELMSTTMAPNVTVQRNQAVPGPMSPRFNSPAQQNQGQLGGMLKTGVVNAQQQHIMFTPRSQAPLQWNQHMMAGGGVVQVKLPSSTPPSIKRQNSESPMKKNQQFVGQRQMQDGVAQFQFGEQQFQQSPSQMGLLSPTGRPQQPQQQQQMFNNRMLQRQISMPRGMTSPGLQSPGAPQPGFNNQGDSMLLSPHGPQVTKVSPGGSTGQMQTSSSAVLFSNNISSVQQATQVTGYNPMTSMAGQSNPTASSLGLQQQPQSYSTQDSLFGTDRKGTSPSSQYVRQELKLVLSKAKANNSLQVSAAQPPEVNSLSAEIPMEILESIESLQKQQEEEQAAQQHQGGDLNRIEDVRKEAHLRFQQFNELSNPVGIQPQEPENQETRFFRSQLLSKDGKAVADAAMAGKMLQQRKPSSSESVKVVQTEPRTPIADIKPAEHKNSLLQQLLSSD